MSGTASGTASTSKSAPVLELPYPLPVFTSIEFPGPVSTSAGSVEAALDAVGGLQHLNRTLASEEAIKRLVELQLGDSDSKIDGIHPVQGEIIPTQNLIIKITKRRRKGAAAAENALRGEASVVLPGAKKGSYTAEVVGLVTKTVRFRTIADFQFVPDRTDPILQFSECLRKMDLDAISSFRFSEPHETFAASAGTETQKAYPPIPPGVFARLSLPTQYNYKSNPISVPTTTLNPVTGEEVTRLINKDRYKGAGMTLISFSSTGEVPSVAVPPPKTLMEVDLRVIDLTLKLMETRPVWTKFALMQQLSPDEAKRMHNNKHILPQCGYGFTDGPFREMVISFGHDPRMDETNRQYQRIIIRNLANPQSKMSKDPNLPPHPRPHVFDGQSYARNVGNFQVCDIEEPSLRALLDDEQYWISRCTEKGGFYLPNFYSGFRELLRLKFLALVKGETVDEETFTSAVARLPNEDDAAIEREYWLSDPSAKQGTEAPEGAEEDENPGAAIAKRRRSVVSKSSTKPAAKKSTGGSRKKAVTPVIEEDEDQPSGSAAEDGDGDTVMD